MAAPDKTPPQKDPPARRDTPVDEPPGRARNVPLRRAPDERDPKTHREPDPNPDDDKSPPSEPDTSAPIGEPPPV